MSPEENFSVICEKKAALTQPNQGILSLIQFLRFPNCLGFHIPAPEGHYIPRSEARKSVDWERWVHKNH